MAQPLRWCVALACAAGFAFLLFARLSAPLLWQDEAETVMYGERVLDFGYPRLHDRRGANVFYGLTAPLDVGVKEELDAYIGSTWGQYYFAAAGALWARTASDPYEKTLRLRLPFAVAGAAAVGLWALALARLFRDVPGAAPLAVAAYLGLAGTQISLILHLREARYYALAALLVSGTLLVHVRWRALQHGSPLRGALLEAALLFLLFHVFSPGCFALGAGLGLDVLRQSWRVRRQRRRALRELALGAAPLLGAAALVAPFAVWFETFRVAEAITRGSPASLDTWLASLIQAFAYLSRHDVLLPALLLKLVLLALRVAHPGASDEPALRTRLAAGDAIGVVLLGYGLAIARIPMLFERYLVPLCPALAAMLVLDASSLLRLATLRFGSARAAALLATLLCSGMIPMAPARWSGLRGRLEEIRVRYEGPIDHAVRWIAARYPGRERLVIATNYEAPALMYYLDGRVISSYYLGVMNEPDRALTPDIVIVRTSWPGGQEDLRAFLERGRYVKNPLPVGDYPFNNIPALFPSASLRVVHQFRKPLHRDHRYNLVIWARDAASVETGEKTGGARDVSPGSR